MRYRLQSGRCCGGGWAWTAARGEVREVERMDLRPQRWRWKGSTSDDRGSSPTPSANTLQLLPVSPGLTLSYEPQTLAPPRPVPPQQLRVAATGQRHLPHSNQQRACPPPTPDPGTASPTDAISRQRATIITWWTGSRVFTSRDDTRTTRSQHAACKHHQTPFVCANRCYRACDRSGL